MGPGLEGQIARNGAKRRTLSYEASEDLRLSWCHRPLYTAVSFHRSSRCVWGSFSGPGYSAVSTSLPSIVVALYTTGKRLDHKLDPHTAHAVASSRILGAAVTKRARSRRRSPT